MKLIKYRPTAIQKVLLVFFAVIFLFSTSFFALFSHMYKTNVQEIVADEMESNLERINEYLNLIIDNTQSLSSALMGNDILQRIMIHNWDSVEDLYKDQNFRTFSTLFNDISRANKFIVSTDLYLQKYHLLMRSDLGATSRLTPDLIQYFDHLTSVNDDFWIAYDYNETINRSFRRSTPCFTVIRPLYSFYSGEQTGFISISIKTETIQRVLTTMQGAQCVILNESQHLILEPTHPARQLPPESELLSLLPLKNGTGIKTLHSIDYIVSVESLKALPWHLVSYTPINQLVHKGFRLQNYLFGLIISFLLIICIAAGLLINFFSKRIHKLVLLMSQVQAGDFSVSENDIGKDEFSYLFRSFQSMAQNVDNLINKVYRLELMHRDVQLHLLQSQVNPHFIYNIFNNMHWLLKLQRYEDLDTMIQGVSIFYSRSLNNGKLLIRIDRILEQMESYLKIQQCRFRNRFTFSLCIEEILYKKEILNLLLMPLLENSIIHGIEPLPGSFHIDVSGKKSDDCIVFTIKDNGAGIPRDELENITLALHQKKNDSEKYFALRNIHRRIQMFYGENYGLTIESSEGKGTSSIVTIPFPEPKQDFPLEDRQEGVTHV